MVNELERSKIYRAPLNSSGRPYHSRPRRPVAIGHANAMDSLFLCWKIADPDSLCCWLAQMDAGGHVACHRQRHSLIVFALMDAHARARTQIQAGHEIEKLGVFFIDAQNFVASP